MSRTRPLISVYTKNAVNPNYLAFRLGAEMRGRELGADIVHRVPSKPDDAAEQIRLLESELASPPDGILFNPADDEALIPMVDAIVRAKIPILNFINRMKGDFVSFVGSDEVAIGAKAARYLCRHLSGAGNIVAIEGPKTATTSRERMKGVRSALAEFPHMHLIGTACGYYLEQGGHRAMQCLFERYPIIDGVIALNDSMALGAIEAMKEESRMLPIVGSNGTADGAKAIRDRHLLASVEYDAFKMGSLSLETMLRHLRGAAVPLEILMPADIIDHSNYETVFVPLDKRTCPPWPDGAAVFAPR